MIPPPLNCFWRSGRCCWWRRCGCVVRDERAVSDRALSRLPVLRLRLADLAEVPTGAWRLLPAAGSIEPLPSLRLEAVRGRNKSPAVVRMTASELGPRSVGGTAGQGGSGSSAAPSNSPGGAADLDLDAIEARADAATVGPWTTQRWSLGLTVCDDDGECLLDSCDGAVPVVGRRLDAAFIAAARTDVPVLVAEVRALRAEVAVLNAETRARCERIRAVLDRK